MTIYLEQETIVGKDMQTSELNRRIRNAWNSFGRLNYILRNKTKKFTKMKIWVLEQCVIPVLKDARETWAFTSKIIKTLHVNQRNMERTILNIWVKDKKMYKMDKREN